MTSGKEEGMIDMDKLQELVTAEFGDDFMPYLGGYTQAIGCALAGGCHDPGWMAMALEIGMQAALRDPEFARKLADGLGYGRQLVGMQEGTDIIEHLTEVLLSGKVNRDFGRMPEGG